MRLREAAAALAVGTPFLLGLATTGQAPAAADDDVVIRFQDPDIVESSGLVALGDRFVTVNDSGDSARVFVVDARTGETADEVAWPSDTDDVEAVAPAGRDAVWVGDIGDNTRSRPSVTVTRVPLDGSAVSSFQLVYPDGARDAEALLVHPRTGRLLVVSKGVFGGRLYAAPAELDPDGPNRLVPVGETAGIVTDAAFFPDGRHLLVRTYTQAVVHAWPSMEIVGTFGLPRQEQGEGIAVSPAGEVFASSEGQRAPVLRIRLPAEVSAAMLAPEPSAPAASGRPEPDRTELDVFDRAASERPVLPWAVGLVVFLGLIWVAARASRPPR